MNIFKSPLSALGVTLAIVLALCAAPVSGQNTSDIDIYSANTGGSATNVLFVLDNTSNWNADNGQGPCYYKENGIASAFGPSANKKKNTEPCALYNVIDSLPIGAGDTALFNIGFMLFNDNVSNGVSGLDNGARAIKAFTPVDTAGKASLKTLIKTLDQNLYQAPASTSFALAMHEAYLYYTGATPFSGKNGTYDLTAISALTNRYALPTGSACSKNYVIVIANGPPQSDKATNSAVTKLLGNLGGNTTTIAYPTGFVDSADQANLTDEYARFLATNNIVTYAIAVTGASSDKVTYPNIYSGIAKAGGGDFFVAASADTIALALGDIFNQLQAVDSVFSSASLPVSVNARGSYQNQIFMGMFRPDSNSYPRWSGNVKQFKFAYNVVTDSLYLSDQNGNAAISGATGFLSTSAKSYWTTPSTFWINDLKGTPRSASDSPDGEVVEKGGAAQRIREVYVSSQADRKIYTCIACAAGTSLSLAGNTTQFVVSNTLITSTTLAVTSTTARDNLINWARGTNNNSETGPGTGSITVSGTTSTATATIRPSVHGDVLHSRPAVVNYGTTTGVVVFYGSNDGTLRAINGSETGAAAGNELWSFIPQELFPKLNRLRNNTPEVRISTTSSTLLAPTLRDYFVDGPMSVYQKTLANGTNEKVYLYAAMRRGGRLLYALDVTDPAVPKFLWKKSEADIPGLGQTWSEPKVAKIRGNANPVLIMGGGYDSAAEDLSPRASTTNIGTAVFVLDAFTGNLIKSFPTTRSVPADVALIDSDFDGYVDRVYAADVGGDVYRIDLEKTAGGTTTFAVSDWGIYKVAALSGAGTRKFFYPPDVVIAPTFAALMVGSGDREKPLAAISTDAFFTIKDFRTSKGTTSTFTAIVPANLVAAGTALSTDAPGCYMSMAVTGEKIVNAPTTVGGITYFSTNQPSALVAACVSNLGTSKVYSAPLFCKAATSQNLLGGGLPPSPVSGTVQVTYIIPAKGTSPATTATKLIPFIIGAPNSKGSAIEGSKVNPTIVPVRSRRYWYLENAR